MRKRLPNGTFKVEHGYTGTKIYCVWKTMLQRCNNKNHIAFSRYGGKGIKVCNKWKDFSLFIRDMGDIPLGKTLERKDNHKGYSKENCVWATRKIQANNRNSNRIIIFNGVKHTLSEWSEITGIKSHTIAKRIDKLGWSIDKALHKLFTEQK